MAYVGMFVTGPVTPAIVYAGRRGSWFCRRHAGQAIGLWLVFFGCSVVLGLIAYYLSTVGLFLLLAVIAGATFGVITMAINANRGEWTQLPSIVAPRLFT